MLGIIFYSCGDSEEKKDRLAPAVNLDNPEVLKKEANNILGENVKVTFVGSYDNDPLSEVAAGTEITSKDVWGIRFSLLKKNNNALQKGYQTKLLEGSLTDCHVDKIKFPSFKYELVYYNSRDYFMGSGGGEVFSYIIDFNKGQTFYAHLIAEPERPIYLYLSPNIDSPEIKIFFINNFKRDYSSLTFISEDIDLQD